MSVEVEVIEKESDVGRPGAAKEFVLESSGQTSLPQARSVEQQPPPRLEGQERKPEEHCSVFGLEAGGGGVVLGDEDEEGADEVLDGTVTGGRTVVVVSVVSVVVEIIVAGGGWLEVEDDVDEVGTTTMTVVMTCIHPTPLQAYPGRQQPPPGF